MPYKKPITSATPMFMHLILDGSGSMVDPYDSGAGRLTKAAGLTQTANRFAYDAILACTADGRVRDAVHIAAVCYHDDRIEPALAGPLASKAVVPLSELAQNPARFGVMPAIPEEQMPEIPDHPIWIEERASGGTPMKQAFNAIVTPISDWISKHPDGPPPVIVHVTDGESTDGDPTEAAQRALSLETSDGHPVLFNVHLSSVGQAPIVFPSSATGLPDKHARLLFDISSPLPEPMARVAKSLGIAVEPGARAYVCNARLREVMLALLTASQGANR